MKLERMGLMILIKVRFWYKHNLTQPYITF